MLLSGIRYSLNNIKLNDIMKLQLLKKLSSKDIIEIWKSKNNEKIYSTVMNSEKYMKIKTNSKICKNFIIPIKFNENYYNIFLQFNEKIILFTSLDYIHKFGIKNTNPIIYMTFYDELVKTHDLILLRTNILNNHLNKLQVINLIENTLKFYLDFNLFQWVKLFNLNPKQFNYKQYLNQNKHIFNI
ncbi:uncharacterized protein TA15600 [Theileria annulata]|uniref:ATP11 protein n=1 Tax=Theileria annulata TaxID=5874 RepID=Q4UFK8_THEAN|nr:uncharacterized protein TA15600 [Theileria annulata]CAI74108.1 hypothetical protein, conserved [Theileria annulata]|eukprot:XP_951840.1 hypothetical protein, conserved [Theileria annulata]